MYFYFTFPKSLTKLGKGKKVLYILYSHKINDKVKIIDVSKI